MMKRSQQPSLAKFTVAAISLLLLSDCSSIHHRNAPIPAEAVSTQYALARASTGSGEDELKVLALLRPFDDKAKLALCVLFYISGPADKEADFMQAVIDRNSYVQFKVPSGRTVKIALDFSPVFPLQPNAPVWTADPRDIVVSTDLVPQKPICVRTSEEWSSEFDRADISLRLVRTTYHYFQVPLVIYR